MSAANSTAKRVILLGSTGSIGTSALKVARDLPERVHLNLGRRGRAFRWPPHALEQAQWVKARIDDMWTMEEIRAALERGEFQPSAPASPSTDEG